MYLSRPVWVIPGQKPRGQVFSWRSTNRNHELFLYPATQKVGGVLCYTLQTLRVHRPSICLSVSASFPCSNFSTFWPIFFKLCTDIGIGEEWYEIASGLIIPWHLCRVVYSFRLSVRMFIRSFVCSFVRSYFRPVCGITSKFYVQATWAEYISPTTHQKAFIFGP